MTHSIAVALAFAILPAAMCQHQVLMPDGALAQVGADAGAAEQDAQQRLDDVKDSFGALLAAIGSRTWNQTTEKEQSTVNATLDSVRNVIELWVKQDFEASQLAISNQVNELVGKTGTSLSMKKKADELDTQLVKCRGKEKDLLLETQARLEKMSSVREEKDSVCRQMQETRNFSWELASVPSGLCDFSDVTTEGVCEPFAALQKEIAAKDQEVDANQTLFLELMKKCNSLMDDLDNLIRETTLNNVPGNTAFTAKRLECDKYSRQANVAKCTFGDRLQEKCQSKIDADGLVVKVYHQQEDRIAQWNQSQSIKCKLLRFMNGEQLNALNVSLIPEPLADCKDDVYVNKDGELKKGCIHTGTSVDELPCELAVDFTRDIGAMDYKLNAIDSQMTAENFACSEDNFKFSGFKWSTGAEASDYVKEEFAAAATLAPLGSHPFSFCDAVATEEPL